MLFLKTFKDAKFVVDGNAAAQHTKKTWNIDMKSMQLKHTAKNAKHRRILKYTTQLLH